MKTHLKIPFLALTLGLMAACAGQVEPPATLQPTIAALPTHIPVRFADDLIQTLAPGDILFQQDHEPGLIRPEVQFPFGRVAPFTLYADGTLIYLEEGSSFDEQQLMETSLSPAQSLALLQKLTDLGFGRLESHTDDCARQADGSSLCVADAATTILRGFLPGGQLHEVKIYHDFANDPQAFQSIQEVLNDYTHPDGRPYQPAVATLFLSPVDSTEGRTPAEWPLDEGWLTPMASGDRLVWFIEGEELRTFLSAAPRNMGDSYFEHAGRLYHAFLVPWLPDMDYKSEIQAEFQPPALDTRESTKTAPVTSRFADCPVPSTDPDTADFRIAFVRAGDLWLLDEGQEARALTAVGDVQDVQLTPDARTVIFTRRIDSEPAELWAISTEGNQLRRLAGRPDLMGPIQILPVSDSFPLVAFSHQVDPYNAELWVADLNGADARRLASKDDLIGLLEEPGQPPAGASPTSVRWIPQTTILTYDAYPNYANEGIYIYVQQQVAAVDAMTGSQDMLLPRGQGGTLSFSPDGAQTAIITPDRLSLMNLPGNELVRAGVDYAAAGFGESYFFPPLLWNQDSRSLLLAQHDGDPLSEAQPTVTLWHIPVDGTTARRLNQISGFAPSVVFSPDQSLVAYWQAEPRSNFRELHIARVDGSEDIIYAAGEAIEFLNWAPNSRHFVYGYAGGAEQLVGDICGEPRPLHHSSEAIYPTWLDPLHFLYVAQTPDGQTLNLGTPEGLGGLPLGFVESSKSYDFSVSPRS